MGWKNVTKGHLNINWSAAKNLFLADPHLIWADISNFSGYSGVKIIGPKVRVVVELGRKHPLKDGVQNYFDLVRDQLFPFVFFVPPIYLPDFFDLGGPIYFAAFVEVQKMYEFQAAILKIRKTIPVRYELGTTAYVPAPMIPPLLKKGKVAASKFMPKLLSGNVIAIIDDGCPLAHRNFRDVVKGEWRTRIKYFWDQGVSDEAIQGGAVPSDVGYGCELDENEINDRLNRFSFVRQTLGGLPGEVDEDSFYESLAYSTMKSTMTHGAHVLDAAAGNPDPHNECLDEATAAQIIFVQLPREDVRDTSGAAINLYVLEALCYIRKRVAPDANLVVNVSYGAYAGSHDGTSILESAMDSLLAARHRFAITLPAGNAYNAACHAKLSIAGGSEEKIDIHVSPDDPTDSFLEIWLPQVSDAPPGSIEISVTSPMGDATTVMVDQARGLATPFQDDPIAALIFLSVTSRGDGQVALLAIGPTKSTRNRVVSPSGPWAIAVKNLGKKKIIAELWIERDDAILSGGWSARQAYFDVVPTHEPSDEYPSTIKVRKQGSLSNIATGKLPLVVGGYVNDADDLDINQKSLCRLADYSASGPLRQNKVRRGPDGLAPSEKSVDVKGLLGAGTRSGSVYRMNGTSVAAPQVARKTLNWLATQQGGPNPDAQAIRDAILRSGPSDPREGVGPIVDRLDIP